MQKKSLRLAKQYTRKIVNTFWNVFIDGFLTLLPLCVTIGIFAFSFSLIKSLLSPLQQLEIPYLHIIPHSEFLVMLAIILLAGFFLKSFILRSILSYFESLVARIPLVRPIYISIKQLVDAFSPNDGNPTFKKIVLVEFPRKGMYSIGFLTSEFPTQLTPANKTEVYYSIFVPMTPNPTNGFFIVMAQGDFTEIAITTQEAMSLIMSGGIIQPDRFKN